VCTLEAAWPFWRSANLFPQLRFEPRSLITVPLRFSLATVVREATLRDIQHECWCVQNVSEKPEAKRLKQGRQEEGNGMV
jgi:hypothetical protein